jgi:ADP-ribosylglycohydrolase
MNFYSYTRSVLLLKSINPAGDNKQIISFSSYLNANKYIRQTHKLPETKSTLKIENAIDNASIGEALGFLTENIASQAKIAETFPNGILDVKNVVTGLKNKSLVAPYGSYNNNYLTPENNKLIYSDDSDMAAMTYALEKRMTATELSHPDLFASKLASAMAEHWITMKKSGGYGDDGLYYGTRGYSKTMLAAFSDLAKKNRNQTDWFKASNTYMKNVDNGSLLRAWVIGMDQRISADTAFKLGAIQSQITHPNNDVVVSSGALAYIFHQLINDGFANKKQALITMTKKIEENSNATSTAASHIILGIKLADAKVDPILVYNQTSGLKYDDFLMLLSYSFLYFENYNEAMQYITQTPGDNDSLAFVTGAFFGAYYESKINSLYLEQVETANWHV